MWFWSQSSTARGTKITDRDQVMNCELGSALRHPLYLAKWVKQDKAHLGNWPLICNFDPYDSAVKFRITEGHNIYHRQEKRVVFFSLNARRFQISVSSGPLSNYKVGLIYICEQCSLTLAQKRLIIIWKCASLPQHVNLRTNLHEFMNGILNERGNLLEHDPKRCVHALVM